MPVTEFTIQTPRRDAMIDITAEVNGILRESNSGEGIITIYCPHTTAGITINENADPSVTHDMLRQLDEMIPWSTPFYTHGEGNSAAHVKSTLVGCSESIPYANGEMVLGTWQGIYFCEFDGPRTRRVIIST